MVDVYSPTSDCRDQDNVQLKETPKRYTTKFHTVDTVHLRHIKLSYRPTDAH
jgi:hypothetical protein